MAKRFTDTDKWKDEWFLELEPMMKILWVYILDTCDHAGIWKANFKLASYSVGTILDKQSAIKAFKNRINVVSDDKWHITKFISYQYKGRLNPEKNNAHRGVINSLILNGIDTSPYLAPREPLPSQPTLVTSPTGLGLGLGLGLGNSSSLENDEAKKNLPELQNEENLKRFTPDHFVDLWNEYFGTKLSFAAGIGSGKHRDNFMESLRFLPFEQDWRNLFDICLKTPKCMGQNDIGWAISPTWIVNYDNAIKVLNGDFDEEKAVRSLIASMKSTEESA